MTVFRGRRSSELALAMLMVVTVASQAAADTLIIQGSTTFNRRIMEQHQSRIEVDSKHELTVIPNKSMPGLIALLEGRAHMAMISASLKSETKNIQNVMPGLAYDRLQAHDVLTTRIAVALHPSNPLRKASLTQVKKILLGEIKNWSELGGKDNPIRVVLVGGGGVTTVIESELFGGQPIKGSHTIFVKTPVQLVQVIEQEPGAVGFGQVALTQSKGLPELTTEQPIQQTLSFITMGDPTPQMKAVIDATRKVAAKTM